LLLLLYTLEALLRGPAADQNAGGSADNLAALKDLLLLLLALRAGHHDGAAGGRLY
jgi:hypothetical protein